MKTTNNILTQEQLNKIKGAKTNDVALDRAYRLAQEAKQKEATEAFIKGCKEYLNWFDKATAVTTLEWLADKWDIK